MKFTMKKFVTLMASSAIAFGVVTLAYAQDNAGSAPASAQQGSATSAGASSATERKLARQRARAERKAARKQARTQRRAEMKKLEDSGYSPAANDPNYPNSLQNAQKKAGAGAAASQ
ncbi:DUF4148 domain-containing protein [Burkholderia diffusa]|uniref:DUF4148 domain-containing protein n=1 Tax=Burkholderia diffusa TaxID=488732 RepID=UPI001589FAAA|nr:DUF4148 domain-containing protein [Burkholderia diffusa]